MVSSSYPGASGAMQRGSFARTVMESAVVVVATVLAAIGVVLPWRVKHYYASVLRWFRNLLMQNSRTVRTWALRKRWEWDDHGS